MTEQRSAADNPNNQTGELNIDGNVNTDGGDIFTGDKIIQNIDSNFDLFQITSSRQHVILPFIENYMGTKDGRKRHRPFGGRDGKITEMSKWLFEQDAAAYGLMVANAGMGKSALLLRWLDDLRNDERFAGWHLVYYPISARFSTNREVETLKTIAAGARGDSRGLDLGFGGWRRLPGLNP